MKGKYMDIFIVLIILALLWKIKYKGTNDEYLSYKTSTAWRGFFMMLIMCHHLAQYTSSGKLFVHFVRIGFLTVAIFFFFSGYGLLKKHISDSSYKNSFLKKRITAIVVPYAIMTFVVWVVRAIGGKVFSLSDIFVQFAKGQAIVPFSWYFTNILFFYLAFYLLMKLFGNRHNLMIAGALVCYFVWIGICKKAGFDVWWYCSSQLFIVGMIWAKYEKQILDFIKNHYFISIGILVIAFLMGIILHLFISRYVTFIDAIALTKIIIAILFTVAIMMFSLKFSIGNLIIDYIGKISFELYLSHGMFIWIFNKIIANDLLKSVLVVVSSFAFSVILHKILNMVLVRNNKSKSVAATIGNTK